jgi:hypothetical protein
MTEALSIFLTMIENMTIQITVHHQHTLSEKRHISEFSALWEWCVFTHALLLAYRFVVMHACLIFLPIHHIHTPHSLIPLQKLHAQFLMFSFTLIFKTHCTDFAIFEGIMYDQTDSSVADVCLSEIVGTQIYGLLERQH